MRNSLIALFFGIAVFVAGYWVGSHRSMKLAEQYAGELRECQIEVDNMKLRQERLR